MPNFNFKKVKKVYYELDDPIVYKLISKFIDKKENENISEDKKRPMPYDKEVDFRKTIVEMKDELAPDVSFENFQRRDDDVTKEFLSELERNKKPIRVDRIYRKGELFDIIDPTPATPGHIVTVEYSDLNEGYKKIRDVSIQWVYDDVMGIFYLDIKDFSSSTMFDVGRLQTLADL